MSNKFKTINHRRTVWRFDVDPDDYKAGRFTVEGQGVFEDEPFTEVKFWSTDPEKMTRDGLMTLAHMLQEVAMNMTDPAS